MYYINHVKVYNKYVSLKHFSLDFICVFPVININTYNFVNRRLKINYKPEV